MATSMADVADGIASGLLTFRWSNLYTAIISIFHHQSRMFLSHPDLSRPALHKTLARVITCNILPIILWPSLITLIFMLPSYVTLTATWMKLCSIAACTRHSVNLWTCCCVPRGRWGCRTLCFGRVPTASCHLSVCYGLSLVDGTCIQPFSSISTICQLFR